MGSSQSKSPSNPRNTCGKKTCQRHVSDMWHPVLPRSSDRLTVKTKAFNPCFLHLGDFGNLEIPGNLIQNLTVSWFIPCFLRKPRIFSARNWSAHFETDPEIRRDFEDGKPIESCEVIPSLIIENTGGHPRSHNMNKSNISTRVSGDWLKPWWKTATFFLSLQSVVSVYWRLWYRNYVQRSEGEVLKRMKITEKSIGINLINLIPSTFWGYPMLLLFVNFQFLSVKPGWSWLKTPCWVAISMAHVQDCDLTMGQTFITLSQLFVGLCQAILRWEKRGKETNLFTFLILSLCWFGNSRFLILGTHMLFV